MKSVAIAPCATDESFALACSCGPAYGSKIQVLSLERMGAADAVFAGFELSDVDGAVLCMSAINTSARLGSMVTSAELLAYSTRGGAVCAYDPRSGTAPWRMEHGKDIGMITAFADDPFSNCLVCGSSTGHCVLWDVRYAAKLRHLQCPGGRAIHCLLPFRTPSSSRTMVLMGLQDDLVAGGDLGDMPQCCFTWQMPELGDQSSGAASIPTRLPCTAQTPHRTAPSEAACVADMLSSSDHSIRALLGSSDSECVLTAGGDACMRRWRLTQITPDVHGCHMFGTGAGLEDNEELIASYAYVPCEPLVALGADSSSASLETVCTAAVTSLVYCRRPGPGLLFAGSLDGSICLRRHVW